MNPRAFVFSLAFSIITILPASADVTVRDIQFRRQGENLNIRVIVKNRAKTIQAGPVKITLFLRPDERSEWKEATTWEDIPEIKGGDSVTRDVTSDKVETLKNTASNPDLQAKIVVEAPGAESGEKIVINNGYQKI